MAKGFKSMWIHQLDRSEATAVIQVQDKPRSKFLWDINQVQGAAPGGVRSGNQGAITKTLKTHGVAVLPVACRLVSNRRPKLEKLNTNKERVVNNSSVQPYRTCHWLGCVKLAI